MSGIPHYANSFFEFDDEYEFESEEDNALVFTNIADEYAEWCKRFVVENGEFQTITGREILQQLGG